jgi:threonine-phosphate decarboxylase
MIYGHGNERYNLTSTIKADFSSNVWYKGALEEIISVLSNNITCIADYPEPDAYSLKNKIATYYNLKEENIIATNGATEALYLIAQAFTGKRSVIMCPSFSEYTDACQIHQHQITCLSNTSGWQSIRFENRVVWFANPNNPDGKTITSDEIALMLKNNPSSVFVLDEAYIELCHGIETAIPLLAKYSNLIIVRSFTKAFSIPGLRLGYIISSEKITEKIKSFLMPWNINSLANQVGVYIMEHYDRLLPDKEIIRKESIELQKELGKIKKLKVFPSGCNFFMVQSLLGPARELKKFLVEEYGILIRDASNFKDLDQSFFRVAVQKPDMNRLLVKGIKYWMQL